MAQLQGAWTLITFLINSLVWICMKVCVYDPPSVHVCEHLCFRWRLICRLAGMVTKMQSCAHTQTHTDTPPHGWPDATWAVSGELWDTLILRLVMAIINHMILNHFRDEKGGWGLYKTANETRRSGKKNLKMTFWRQISEIGGKKNIKLMTI